MFKEHTRKSRGEKVALAVRVFSMDMHGLSAISRSPIVSLVWVESEHS